MGNVPRVHGTHGCIVRMEHSKIVEAPDSTDLLITIQLPRTFVKTLAHWASISRTLAHVYQEVNELLDEETLEAIAYSTFLEAPTVPEVNDEKERIRNELQTIVDEATELQYPLDYVGHSIKNWYQGLSKGDQDIVDAG